MSHRLPHRQHHHRCSRRPALRERLAGSSRSDPWSPQPSEPAAARPRRSPPRSRAPGWPWERASGRPDRVTPPEAGLLTASAARQPSSAAEAVQPARVVAPCWPSRCGSPEFGRSALCRPRRNQSDSTDSKIGSRLPWPRGPAGGTTTSRRVGAGHRCCRGPDGPGRQPGRLAGAVTAQRRAERRRAVAGHRRERPGAGRGRRRGRGRRCPGGGSSQDGPDGRVRRGSPRTACPAGTGHRPRRARPAPSRATTGRVVPGVALDGVDA